MNNYPAWWNATITLYNKFVDKDTKRTEWYKHVIPNCYYSHVLDKVTVGRTTIESKNSICRIRVSDLFRDPKAWKELTEADKHKYFTLGTGDIIVADEVAFEIDEYEQGARSSDLKSEYKDWPGCFTIEYIGINVGGGRGNEHYLAKGV